MANSSLKVNTGKNIMLHRTYTPNASLSSTVYLPPSQFKVGINNATPSVANTDLTFPVPIANGTVLDDGSTTFDSASTTDNTTTYKEGAGATDNTAQNLIDTFGSTNPIGFYIADLSVAGTNANLDQYTSCWIYIKDQTTLDKIVSIRMLIGHSIFDYYYTEVVNADLSIGWNLITTDGTLASWDRVNTGESGDLDYFRITITKSSASDTFAEGDLVYDLLRQWEASDTVKDFIVSSPTLDYVNNEATVRTTLSVLEANGYLINALGYFNKDTNVKMDSVDVFDSDSKSSTDIFTFVAVDRLR